MDNSNFIKVSDVQFVSNSTVIVSDMSFAIAAGEYVSIVGPNGAGKTTLLRLLAGVISPTSGSIEIATKPINSYSRKALSRLVAYLPQKYSIFAPYSVSQFLELSRYAYLGPLNGLGTSDRQVVESIIEKANLGVLSQRSVMSLSSGERQKVMLAAALVQEPRILMLDEPCTFLDPHHQEEIQTILLRLRKETKITLVVVTHDVNSAVLYSDRILAIKAGRLVLDKHPQAFMQSAHLASVFDAAPTLAQHPLSPIAMVVPTRLAV